MMSDNLSNLAENPDEVLYILLGGKGFHVCVRNSAIPDGLTLPIPEDQYEIKHIGGDIEYFIPFEYVTADLKAYLGAMKVMLNDWHK